MIYLGNTLVVSHTHFKDLNTLTSAGCIICVELGGKAYIIIWFFSENKIISIVKVFCGSTNKRTGFFIWWLSITLIYSIWNVLKQNSIFIQPVSDIPRIQSGGMLSTTALEGIYGKTTVCRKIASVAENTSKTVIVSFSLPCCNWYNRFKPFDAIT